MRSRHAGQQPDARGGKRGAFRAWRRSRPFWGGTLLLIAGLELLSIPLSGVLIKGAIKLVIYIGIGGVAGVGIGALLIAAGLVMWFNPAHRVFYGIAGIVLGILSFPASNLGGFFLGMLLAIIGGSLSFAWTPAERPPLPFAPPAGEGHRVLAIAVAPACILGILCLSPSPSPSASPSPSLSPSTANPGGPVASPSPAPSSGSRSPDATVNHARAPSGVVAPSAMAVLTAGSATLRKLNLTGIATLPVGGGGSERALEFTASSAAMSGVEITVTQDGSSVVTKTTSLDFDGGMRLFATKLCGRIEGITPTVCFTPSTASQVVLQLASALGKAVPITMTDVTTDRFVVSAGTMRWGTLSMGAE